MTSEIALLDSIANSMDQIFEPLSAQTLATLFQEYREKRQRMIEVSSILQGDQEILEHFVVANGDRQSSSKGLFEIERALKVLDSVFWQRALELTDVLELMPQKRRENWFLSIEHYNTPPFEEGSVISTLQNLLAQRHLFFAEYVDGIFQNLSRAHITNRPEGFSKRMILEYVYNGGYVDWRRSDTINDLRSVVAKFMGRAPPRTLDTNRAIEYARRNRVGQWVPLDGGSIRIRLYKKGTAHLEIHPEMVWRLNSVLASIYPNAIPDHHRVRSKTQPPKDFQLFTRPLPRPVLDLLAEGRQDKTTFSFGYGAHKSSVYQEARDVLEILGGQPQGDQFAFDYSFGHILAEVIHNGVIPDQRAHQYYPTPRYLAKQMAELADLSLKHSILEPSAGQGHLAYFLPANQTTAVEIAPLHCAILRAKGFSEVIEADFLAWKPKRRFDRIVMSPPFGKGMWRRHLTHASTLVAEHGKIIAILPTGASNFDILPGWNCVWGTPQPFPGTSIEIKILVATPP